MVARLPSAEEWIAEVNGIIHQYREGNRSPTPAHQAREQAIELRGEFSAT